MSIPFEIHLFCLKLHKQGSIKVNENIKLHFQITSDTQHRYWYVAVTEQIKEQYIIREDLGMKFESWASAVNFAPNLLKLYNTKAIHVDEVKQDLQLQRTEFAQIVNGFEYLFNMLKEYEKKWR